MGYGLTFEDVNKINRPKAGSASWGSVASCTGMPEYSLHRIEILADAVQPLHFHPSGAGHLFVEAGDVLLRVLDEAGRQQARTVRQGSWIEIAPHLVYSLGSKIGAVTYLAGPHVAGGLKSVPVESEDQARQAFAKAAESNRLDGGNATSNVLEKYWGRIETFADGDVAAKRLFVKQGGQSSMEFHVHKRETYFIHSGRLKIGLRVGRAENRSIVLEAGDSYDILPGFMHMRIALADTVIIEASTRDSDSDSFLVEDGQTYKHIESPA
jgi:mannose-6-phosphate isomerase-like protein (cupin superfamily)